MRVRGTPPETCLHAYIYVGPGRIAMHRIGKPYVERSRNIVMKTVMDSVMKTVTRDFSSHFGDF